MRRGLAFLAICCSIGLSAVGATAASKLGRPAGSPDLAAMALSVSDFPAGAKIDSQGYYADPDYVASYERFISLGGVRVGRSRLLFVLNDLSVDTSASVTEQTFDEVDDLLATKSGRDLLKNAGAEGFAEAVGSKVTKITIGKPRRAKIGDGTVSILFRVTARRITLDMVIVFTYVDRVFGVITIAGVPKGRIHAVDVDRITRVSAERMRAGLVPVSDTPPTVTGTPLPGQLLAATTGTWRGDQIALRYQWRRCDGSGGGCTDIPGAATLTYTVSTGDLGSTLRVTQIGSNALGAVTAPSTPSAVVVGPPGSPVAAAAPAIAGTVAQGQTLALSTGTWSGDPASFAYQWRRCDAAGTSCVDVAGATATTYAVTAADAGKTIRVLVVATNASGSGGAITAQTAVVVY